jgi:hypothetical protein
MVNFYDQEILFGLLDIEVEGFAVLQSVGSPLPADMT